MQRFMKGGKTLIMFEIKSPSGSKILIPNDLGEDKKYFTLNEFDEAKNYYGEYGYVVFRGLVSKEKCIKVINSWNSSLKKYDGFIYRQTTANPEKNVFDKFGHVLNPVLNLQDLDSKQFGDLKNTALDIFTDQNVIAACRALIDDIPKLVQSMYFEGNPATWAHQDSYYLDSEKIGSMTAAWFALEDIHSSAGRFYVYSGSHLIDLKKNGGDFDIAFNHERYKKLVIEIINKYKLECKAPFLAAGDVLFWNAKTIHGSLVTMDESKSRSSLTAHYIPESHKFLQFQSRIKSLKLKEYNGINIHCPKNQDYPLNKFVLFLETRFPSQFQSAKKLAVKLVTSKKN